MGGRGSSSSKAKNGGGGSSNNTEEKTTGYKLQEGEQAVVRLTPNWLNPEGQVIVIKDNDGNYVYKVGFSKDNSPIDTNSTEYKRALSEYNVKASVKTDGTVEISKGGLYSRKKTFKTVDAFQKDVNDKLDSRISYYQKQADSMKKGVLPYSQVQAENYQKLVRTNEPNALTLIAKDLNNSIHNARTKVQAAEDMKSRLNMTLFRKRNGL